VREVALEAYSHQELPFEKLVEELQPERDLSRNPLFQVMFVLQNAPGHELELAGLEVSPLEVDTATAKFDLALSLTDREEGLAGVLEYSADLFERETVERLAGHYRRLLEGVVADEEERISRLPLLTPAEQQQLLVEWNRTEQDYPAQSSVAELFERQAEERPEAEAVVYEGERWSYGELNGRANQLAHYLRQLGVGPEVRVGICLERSLELVAGLLGILKAGGAYVPLDPAYPQQRLAWMVEDAGVEVLLTQERLLGSLPSLKARVVCLDRDWGEVAGQPHQNPGLRLDPDQLAYVIYTSGSTGIPKGVQITQRALVNILDAASRIVAVTDKDALLAVSTISFDIATLDLLLPLTVGARVIVGSREVAVDGTQLLERLTNSGVTILQATPATWRLLLEADWEGDKDLKVLCGGEALPRDLANQLLVRGEAVWNLYGPTETTIYSTAHRLRGSGEPILIGRPIANTQTYILDSGLQPVPVGVTGELYIGGVGVARGYLNQPELTATNFIPDSFSLEPGARLYRTGDLARYRPKGNMEFLGRRDHQVKVRGFRIELGEIEAVLTSHPDVRTAVVVAKGEAESRRLLAFVIPQRRPGPGAIELRQYLRDRLPDYMLPSAFVELETLPLTPSGKVDRRALPEPEAGARLGRRDVTPPRTPVEELVANIWAEVLKRPQVGIEENFFELGGHSLLAMQVMSRIRKAFEVNLPLRLLFESPTVAGLTTALLGRMLEEPEWIDLKKGITKPRGSLSSGTR
jgi:amino acid adenylation domain-containing protein